ncbi:polysaccharide biosynthesis/export family protein [Botrimarina hoheduenensis]|uniref:Polysaccharide biosynthesis/export protein n=1 Tax=Botrimarina hoheduenensis TaxID=2528000 RepID=A0A5C5WAC7_9BACT|nr:polysaccharide biosynthesis/export family protein [Botrimarina hoheduenensis]TWT47263.1 Polysaccharide biosynthesis/export protein [Botrimarina hoheduenensis]
MNGDLTTPSVRLRSHRAIVHLVLAASVVSNGCTAFVAPRESLPITPAEPSPLAPAPRELEMMTLERYRIEPPDVLLINAIKVVPKPPHTIEPFDGLLIRAAGALPDQPIADAFAVDPEGTVDLGPSYGKVKVSGLTIDEAQDAVRKQLAEVLEEPEVSVSLAFSTGAQQIAGEHLVGPDGRVNLGTYGSVYVTGMTLDEAKAAIEARLGEQLMNPEVVVQILAYNSKRYYVITQGGGFGDSIVPQPITGKETVLDALSAIGGISQLSSTKMWIARPAPNGVGCEQILPIAYNDITRGASTATNYQLLPGDRLFIADDPMTRFDAVLGKITRPLERVFGVVSLGTATINRIDRFGLGSL